MMAASDWQLLIDGTVLTVLLATGAFITSLIIAFGLAIVRRSPVLTVRTAVSMYMAFFRSVPLLVVLFFLYFGAPRAGLYPGAIWSTILGLALCSAPYIADVLQAGMASVSITQIEAARALGLTRWQTLIHLQLAIACRVMVSPMATRLIDLIKGSSLGSAIGVNELLLQTDRVSSATFNPNMLLVAGAIYTALTLTVALIANFVNHTPPGGTDTSSEDRARQ